MKLVKLLWTIPASILGAILYRMGGTSLGTLWRDLGVSAVVTGLLGFLMFPFTWQVGVGLFISMGLLYGALTAYWKKGDTMKWINWYLHGFGICLSALPIAISSGKYIGFTIRIIICPLLIAFWSDKQDIDWVEETGRGFLTVITAPLLLV